MDQTTRGRDDRMGGIYETVNAVAVWGTLTFLACVCLYLIGRAADRGMYPAVRSIAAVVLPSVLASAVYVFNRRVYERLGEVSAAPAFGAALLFGSIVMAILRVVPSDVALPVPELVASASFSILAFTSRTLPERRELAYYYGVFSGMLVYVILFGFPLA